MNNIHKRTELIVLVMLISSLLLYGLDYLLFGQAREIGFGLLGNLAFLPIYVLFVTLMIERVLKERDKEALRQKMNMVIGVFFSEVGTHLLRDGFAFLVEKEQLSARVRIAPGWTEADFRELARYLDKSDLHMNSSLSDLGELKAFLVDRRMFLLGLLENPNLLEHDGFTDLLWAVFHLLEELEARRSLTGLPPSDMDHLSGDLRRAYTHLLSQWVVYLKHLKTDYPYLFSLAVRNNPLNPDARVEIGA
jgi:hypothetical protein